MNLDTFECTRVLEGHSDIVYYLELTSDGNLFSCSGDKTVKLWELETGKELQSIDFDHYVYCVKILVKDLVVVGLQNDEIRIYDLCKRETVKTIKSYASRFHLLSNGNLLSACREGVIKLWDIL